jgi:mutator protein MutT
MKKERFKLTAAVYLVLIRENKILLLRRCNTGYFDGYYSFPAGHVEKEETLTKALIREAREEIGIILDPTDLKLIHVMNRRIPNDERLDFFFTTEKWKGEPRIMEADKCNDLSWFGLNNLPKNTIPYIKQAIDCILKNIIYSEREGYEKLSTQRD